MKIGTNGLNLIKSFEGLRHKPYLCPANVPTIGYGTTIYPNGIRVTTEDKAITEEEATVYLMNDVRKFEQSVEMLVKPMLSQNQFDALVSFAYNLGTDNLSKSTLLKKINKSPYDTTIHTEFLKWNKADGRALAGLTRRRKAEAYLYFKH